MYDIVATTVNYKMKEKILKMLSTFFADIEGLPLKIKFVAVDNASFDGLAEELAKKYPQVDCLVNQRNLGFGEANNLVFSKYQAKYFFLINPDISFPPNQRLTENLYNFLEENQKIGLVAPRLILTESNTVQPSCLCFPSLLDPPFYRLGLHKRYLKIQKRVSKFLMEDFDHQSVLPVEWVTGAALFIRSKALKEVGFFDRRFFMYFEDCDLCRRFWKAGWPVYYKGDVFLYHQHERASAKIPGVKSIFKNHLTRVHLQSLIKYWWKWRGDKI